MIRKFVLACAMLLPFAGTAAAQSSIQQMQQIQIGKPGPQISGGDNGAELQRIGATLQQIIQQMQSYGVRQKSSPQTLAMLQVMLVQADYMRNVAGVLYRQSQVGSAISPTEKLKKQAAKKTVDETVPALAKQKEATTKSIANLQAKLEEAAKKVEQAEKAKQAKDQGGQLVAFQTALLQAQARLERIMLAELLD